MNKQRIASTAGIVACIVLLVATVISALGYVGKDGEHYSITNHFVSELGRAATSHAALVFNSALMISAVLLIVFANGLRQRFDGWSGKVIGVLSLLAFVSCFFVGVFPAGKILLPHLIAAAIFFPSVLALAFFVSVMTIFAECPTLPKWTAVFGISTAIAFAALLLAPRQMLQVMIYDPAHFVRPAVWALCLFEWLCFGTVIAWILAVAIVMRTTSLTGRRRTEVVF